MLFPLLSPSPSSPCRRPPSPSTACRRPPFPLIVKRNIIEKKKKVQRRRSPVTILIYNPLSTSIPSFLREKQRRICLYRNLGLCFAHLPRHLVEEDATPPATATATSVDSVATTGPSSFPSPPSVRSSSVVPFQPSIAVVVGVVAIMFSLTFLLILLYAKHCKQTSAWLSGGGSGSLGFPAAAERRNSGVERTVVKSLPVFRFGSLRGHKEGLECAVCLNRFEPAKALRLLPKCRHAFHVECVDTWLDAHSTCPLCRLRVDREDVLLVPDPLSQPDPKSQPSLLRRWRQDAARQQDQWRRDGRESDATWPADLWPALHRQEVQQLALDRCPPGRLVLPLSNDIHGVGGSPRGGSG